MNHDVQGLSPAAVAHLVDGHARFLAFLERRLPDRTQAEEILQHAFVRALERGHTLRDGETATAWFYRLLRNALVDHYRHRGAEQRALEAAANEPIPAHDEELLQTVCGCVRVLIDTLKPSYGDAVRSVDLEGMSVVDYARRTGISTSNAGVRLHRARQALYQQLVVSCGTCATHGCLDCHCGSTC